MMARAIFYGLFFIASISKGYAEETKELNLTDLGFSKEETLPSVETQTMLEDRRFYLKQHQIWGLVSAGAMAMAVFSGGEGDLPPEHPFFAGLAVTSYAAAAYTAWKAPEIDKVPLRGGSAWHRRLIWVHLPGMILTPILGYMAAKKIDKNEKLDGPEKYHKDAAGITAVALVLSALTVSFDF
ncbi:MAG: hypothetical protein KDD45_17995 [Bdellovibrionales bacterium]|nr:hypothetical protein [Bdellovibrionales bacterium]